MTTFQYWMIGLTCIGILLSSGGIIAACVWAVAKIKADITEKISEERIRVDGMVEAERENFQRSVKESSDGFQKMVREIAEKFAAEQKSQDHNTGEMGHSLRTAIAELQKKVYEFELFIRDNYALKDDVNASIADLKDTVKAMASDIKTDFRDLNAKIDKAA